MNVPCMVIGGDQINAILELQNCCYLVYCMLEHDRFIQKFSNCLRDKAVFQFRYHNLNTGCHQNSQYCIPLWTHYVNLLL